MSVKAMKPFACATSLRAIPSPVYSHSHQTLKVPPARQSTILGFSPFPSPSTPSTPSRLPAPPPSVRILTPERHLDRLADRHQYNRDELLDEPGDPPHRGGQVRAVVREGARAGRQALGEGLSLGGMLVAALRGGGHGFGGVRGPGWWWRMWVPVKDVGVVVWCGGTAAELIGRGDGRWE